MLKELRISKGIPFSFVAEKLNIDRGTVRKLENGETELKVDWVPTLSYLYGIEKEELIKRYLEEKEEEKCQAQQEN